MKIFRDLDDFIQSARTDDGYGTFYRNIHATVLAKSLSRMQIKKYKKHGIVPVAFFIFLKEAGIIRPTIILPKGGTSKEEFEKIYKQNHIQSEQERSAKEYKEKIRIKKFCDPELTKSFAENHVWFKAGYN